MEGRGGEGAGSGDTRSGTRKRDDEPKRRVLNVKIKEDGPYKRGVVEDPTDQGRPRSLEPSLLGTNSPEGSGGPRREVT